MKLNFKIPKINFNLPILKEVFTSNTLLTMLIWIALIVLINVLGYIFFFRVDITEGRIFTISKATKETYKDLDEEVIIKTYFSENLPDKWASLPTQINDFLDEYKKAGNGKVKIENKKPDTNETDKDDATVLGLPEVEFTVRDNDSFQAKKGYFGIGIYYKDKKEYIAAVENTDTLEYDITSRVKKMTIASKPIIGFLSGHDEPSLDAEYGNLQTELAKFYTVQPVTITNGSPIDANIKLLVIANPKSDLTDREMFEIDQYIMSGGRILWLLEGATVDVNSFSSTEITTNVNNFVGNYGFKLNSDLVLDKSSGVVNMQGYGYLTQINYPFWVVVLNSNVNKEIPALKSVQSVYFPWVSTVRETDKLDGRTVTTILSSSEDSWTKSPGVSIDPLQSFSGLSEGKKPIAMYVSGKQVSAYKDKSVPTVANDVRKADTQVLKEVADSQMVLIGDSEFPIPSDSTGKDFFLNIAEWMTTDGGLIEIRTRNVKERTLKETKDNQKTAIKAANVAAIPVLLIAIGIAQAIYRNKRKPLI